MSHGARKRGLEGRVRPKTRKVARQSRMELGVWGKVR